MSFSRVCQRLLRGLYWLEMRIGFICLRMELALVEIFGDIPLTQAFFWFIVFSFFVNLLACNNDYEKYICPAVHMQDKFHSFTLTK